MSELGWGEDAENLYLDLEANPRKANELEAVNQMLDAIEDDPGSDEVRQIGLTTEDGRRVWKIQRRYRNSDLMAVLWELRDGTPVIDWLGDADYGV